ncbi:hypothetical protein EJ076_09640 [Mesorhizobium sp. M7D.F.Ca.US.005.01.1.1]|nr:hypothetical protein EJ076_09640 [Mesorhizobium sp. M7D.F.Ca.US.005.01.1.1]
MGWEPAGEESRDASLRLRRSRLQLSFGQISPLKRPFGALLDGLASETSASNAPPAHRYELHWHRLHIQASDPAHLQRRGDRSRCRPVNG